VGTVGDRALSTLDERVRASLNWRPLCLEEIVERSGLPAAAVVVSLDSLEQQGLVTGDRGWWTVAKR
jgi:DNA-binding IclR family transcriptional regulator